jgi:toxin ParE1/3/4
MSRCDFSKQASRDLGEIHDYIARHNPVAALRFVELLEDKCDRLAALPETGERREDLAAGLRCFAVARYAILYRPLEDGVEIVRVVSGARDIDALF